MSPAVFDPFPRLPTELQIKIWEQAFLSRRRVESWIRSHREHCAVDEDRLGTCRAFWRVEPNAPEDWKSVPLWSNPGQSAPLRGEGVECAILPRGDPLRWNEDDFSTWGGVPSLLWTCRGSREAVLRVWRELVLEFDDEDWDGFEWNWEGEHPDLSGSPIRRIVDAQLEFLRR